MVMSLWWLVGAQSQMDTTLSHSKAIVLCGQSINTRLYDPGKTQNDGGLTSLQFSHDGSQVPSFNPPQN